jgi:hypothetical protein
LFVRVRPLRLFFRGNRRLSQLPKSPFTASPCSTTPGSPTRLTFDGAWARPPHVSTTKAPPNSFRGSITRLHSLLPTLEGGLSAYQPRVASGDWSGPSGRDSNPQGLDRDFPLFPCFLPFLLIPISLGFGWRHETPSSRSRQATNLAPQRSHWSISSYGRASIPASRRPPQGDGIPMLFSER